MAVNWSWKHKKGVLTWKTLNGNKAKVNLYSANCLGALIHDYKDEETKKDMYQFVGFWNDEQHLKRCLGLTRDLNGRENIYKDVILKVKLNTYYKDWKNIAPHFAKVGIKVELYYKEPKK